MKYVFLFAIFTFLSIVPGFCQQPDSALRRVREQDVFARNPSGELQTLTAAEHLSRAETYSSNRLFPEAREHWSKLITNYPQDAGVPKALFGIARSFMWERQYEKAVEWFDRLIKDYAATKDGREGLAFKGASYVRLSRFQDAAKTYEQYIAMFPNGEKIDSAHLNLIDAYREAGRFDDAERWIETAVKTFADTPTEVNALQARVRMEIFRERWKHAAMAADSLLLITNFKGSMTTADEARYMKALAIEKSGKKMEAETIYSTVTPTSYFGMLVAMRGGRTDTAIKATEKAYTDNPIMFRTDVLRYAAAKKIDPRFLLAIMKQESVFKPGAKSPAGARGLLQLVYDTAIKYKDAAGFPALQPDDLYKANVNIALGTEYVAALHEEFDGMYEGIAASYNAGEDNAARWMKRTKPHDAGLFAAEIGFAETKNYVFKVMNNYRAYKALYSDKLERK